MTLKYKCNRQFTPQQRQSDEIYGIFESETRNLTFDTASNTFVFEYNHYYEVQKGYALTTATKNTVVFNGTFAKEDNKYVVQINQGTQTFEDQVAKETKKVEEIKGKIELLDDGDVLKVQGLDLQPGELTNKERIISLNQVYKKV